MMTPVGVRVGQKHQSYALKIWDRTKMWDIAPKLRCDDFSPYFPHSLSKIEVSAPLPPDSNCA